MNKDLILFANIAGTPIAVHASEVEAVVRLQEVIPVPLMPRHVCGLASLRSRVLTVIDMEARVFGAGPQVRPAALAIVADVGAHSYGFLIDSVSDICRASDGVQPVRGRIDPHWAPFTSGLVELDSRSHLLLTLVDFIATAAPATQAA